MDVVGDVIVGGGDQAAFVLRFLRRFCCVFCGVFAAFLRRFGSVLEAVTSGN